jgi:hypothetical protein
MYVNITVPDTFCRALALARRTRSAGFVSQLKNGPATKYVGAQNVPNQQANKPSLVSGVMRFDALRQYVGTPSKTQMTFRRTVVTA